MYIRGHHAILWTSAILIGAYFDTASGADKVVLKPELRNGQAIYVEFTWSNDTVDRGSDYPDEGRRTLDEVIFGFKHEPLGTASDGTTTIKLTIDRAAIALKRRDVRFSFDTDHPEKAIDLDAYGKKLQSLIGSSLTLTIGCDGTVKDIDGCASMAAQVQPSDTDKHADDVFVVYFILLKPSMMNIWRDYYGRFSFVEVGPGDTWTRSLTSMFGLPPEDTTYKLERIECDTSGQRAIVTHRSESNESEWVAVGDIWLKSGPETYTGKTVIDLDRGRILAGEEQAVQRSRIKRLDITGQTIWWGQGSCEAAHKLLVQTYAQRQTTKGCPQ